VIILLIQFSVENFKSIKNEVVLNFAANHLDQSFPSHIIDIPVKPNKILKSIAIVGPNASGKTNIIDAFLFAVKFILNTVKRSEKAEIMHVPFAFSEDCINSPTKFEFIYYNKFKYVYGFSISQTAIEEEYLLVYYSNKPTTIFDRGTNNSFDFKNNDISIQKQLEEKTSKNRLYLPVASVWNYDKVKNAYEWFENTFGTYFSSAIKEDLEKIISNEKQKRALLKHLKKADFNISDIRVQKKEMTIEDVNKISKIADVFNIPQDMFSEKFQSISYAIELKHAIVDDSGEIRALWLNIDNESDGTQEFIYSTVQFMKIVDCSGVLIEDEFGRSYHQKLSKYSLRMFMSNTYNQNKAQFIFTTHNTQLFKILRHDQIRLIDKDPDTGETHLFSLSDYKIRKNDNIEIGYLRGRYGAIPDIQEVID